MDRREAIKQLAILTGGTLSLSTVAGLMGGCTTETAGGGLETLSAAQNKMVTAISERIIPETDTPGAKAARVNLFIDKMLTDWHTEKEREHFINGLEHTDNISRQNYSKTFNDLDRDSQVEILKQLEKETKEAPDPVSNTDLKPFFDMAKELTIVGYYTSEIGASQELQANIVPGYYEACMPYSEIGSAWSGAGS